MENMDWPGFEPGTSLMYTGCSNQLSYQSVVLRMWVHLIPELSTLTSLTPRLLVAQLILGTMAVPMQQFPTDTYPSGI